MKIRSSKVALLLIAGLALASCSTNLWRSQARHIDTVDNNVCKKLQGPVILYAVFVDTKYTHPWSEYDIRSTLDSIRKATRWLERKANANSIPLTITVQYHQNKRIIPIAQNFPNRTLSGTLFTPVLNIGIGKVDRWANVIARAAGKSLPPDTATSVRTKNTLSDRERLLARLRDLYKTDNVALFYFINNYYQTDVSITLHTGSVSKVEYSVVSFKEPAVIAHEVLHLFGALDLYLSPFDRKRAQLKRKKWATEHFPNEVMAFAYRRIDSLDVSAFTQYLIGWKNEVDESTRRALLGKRIKLVKY